VGKIFADVEGADEGNFASDHVDATSCASCRAPSPMYVPSIRAVPRNETHALFIMVSQFIQKEC
jgi:hypothetical protein